MTAYTTDKDPTTAISVSFGSDTTGPVSGTTIGYLAYLGYKGSEPKNGQETNALLWDLLGIDPDGETVIISHEHD